MAIKRTGATNTTGANRKDKFMANSVIKVPVKIEKSKWILTTGIDIKDNEFIRGTVIKREKVDGNTVQSVRNFNWKVGLYPDLALSKNLVITTYFDDDTKETERIEPSIEADEIMAAAIQDRILEVIENDPTRPIFKLITSSPFYSAEDEVAADAKEGTPEVEETKEPVKEETKETTKEEIKLSKEAINFMKSNKVKGKEAINLSVKLLEEANAVIAAKDAKINKLIAEIATLKAATVKPNTVTADSIIEAIHSLPEEERGEVIYEFIPAEYVEAFDKVNALPEEDTTPAMEDDTDPTPDPEDKMPVPTLFDIEELKAQLKSEILAELREELKASLSLSAKEIAPIVSEDTKKVEEPKQPAIDEDIINMATDRKASKEDRLIAVNTATYMELQKIGKLLKLGTKNVAKETELRESIVKHIEKITKPAATDTTKKDTKPSLAAIRQMNANAINTNIDDDAITWDSDDNEDMNIDIEFDDANDTKPAAVEQKFADAQERIRRSAAEIRRARKEARAASASK